jgi:hypothetical protein
VTQPSASAGALRSASRNTLEKKPCTGGAAPGLPAGGGVSKAFCPRGAPKARIMRTRASAWRSGGDQAGSAIAVAFSTSWQQSITSTISSKKPATAILRA